MGRITKIPSMQLHDPEQWKALRRESIGGSDAAAVLGLNPWVSPYALWAEKTGRTPGFEGNLATEVGTFLEDFVARKFSAETGKKVRRENYILKNEDYPWAHANVDRMIVGEKAGLECKTTSELNLKKFKGGEYPANYYCQMVHYLALTGKERWYLAVMIGNREFKVFTLERDEAEIAALMEAEQRFWGFVRDNTPPPVDGSNSTAQTIAALNPQTGGTVDLTPVCTDIRQYIALKRQIQDLEQQMERCSNSIKQHMGGASTGTYMDIKVSWSERSRSTFDKAAFAKANPDIDLSAYSKTTTSRAFTVRE